MATINVSEEDCWIVARWAFRAVLGPTIEELADTNDKKVILQALALDGLHFPLIDPVQAQRIALALVKAAEQVRSSLLEADPATLELRDVEFIDYLSAIESSLHKHYDESS